MPPVIYGCGPPMNSQPPGAELMPGQLSTRARNQTAFTLIEVLVALVIITFALSAAITSASYYSRNSISLEERTIAHWVAQNAFAEMENTDPWPGTGERSGQAEMASRQWRWEARIQDTPDPSLRRVDIEVFPDQDRERRITRISGFLGERPTRPVDEDADEVAP